MMKPIKFDEQEKDTRYKAYDSDDGINKPTEEQYENSKKLISVLADSIRCSKKRQEELLDQLVSERAYEKDYRGFYDAHREIVRRYEIYEEIESND